MVIQTRFASSAKQGEAANDVDQVDTFVCGDRVRSLRNGWCDSHNERPVAYQIQSTWTRSIRF